MSLNSSAAFPIEQPGPYARGLTKREIFAMAEMQGLLANDSAIQRFRVTGNNEGVDPFHLLASASVLQAAALLAALEPVDAN